MSRRTNLTIATLVAATALSLPAGAQAVFPGDNGQIVIASGRPASDASADLFIADSPTDTFGSALTILAGQHRHPSWSAQGEFITFAIFNGAADRDIWVHDVALGSNVRLAGGTNNIEDDHPTFSPDGTMIAYESEVSAGSNQRDILIRNSDGSGSPVNLTSTATAVEQTPVWSPDGETIYYARKGSMAATDLDIYFEPSDNSSAAPSFVPDAFTATAEWQPEISPNGKRLCFTRGDFGSASADIVVARIDGVGDPVEISAEDSGTPVADYNCGWSPDGETIAWTNGAFGAGQLVFAPSDDSGPITPFADNDPDNFDGNVDWARVPIDCQDKLATITGTDKRETLRGTQGKDVIAAVDGNDEIRAKAGRDRACGGKGDDEVFGKADNDRLFGGPGRDLLKGGPGRDVCEGGAGRDVVKCEKSL